MNDVKGFHLELTNKCYLKCPRCARTEFINKFGVEKWKNYDLNLNTLKSFLDIDLSGMRIHLCGNTGDPIYHSQFLDVVEWFKTRGSNIEIVTNGSYKKPFWWQTLSSLLTDTDSITFSIDGLPENFKTYRINADWDTIHTGLVNMIGSDAKVIWKCIPFRYNESDLDVIEKYAKNLGVDEFIIYNSDRWVDNDDYKPTTTLHLGQKTKYIKLWNSNISNEIQPECLETNLSHFITASGYYVPCCYMADWNFYYKTEFYQSKKSYDISKTTISQILSNEKTINFYNTLTETKLPVCTYNCPKV